MSVPSISTQTDNLNMAQQSQENTQNFDRAIEIANTLGPRDKAWALTAISIQLASLPNIEKALDIAKTIPVENSKAKALEVIAGTFSQISTSLEKEGKADQAIALIKATIETSDTLTENFCRATAFEAIALTLPDISIILEDDQASQIINTMIEMAKPLPDDEKKVSILKHIAKALRIIGDDRADQMEALAKNASDAYLKMRMTLPYIRTLMPDMDQKQ